MPHDWRPMLSYCDSFMYLLIHFLRLDLSIYQYRVSVSR